jgi:hypothetical protein
MTSIFEIKSCFKKRVNFAGQKNTLCTPKLIVPLTIYHTIVSTKNIKKNYTLHRDIIKLTKLFMLMLILSPPPLESICAMKIRKRGEIMSLYDPNLVRRICILRTRI